MVCPGVPSGYKPYAAQVFFGSARFMWLGHPLRADHLSWCRVVCATEHVRRIVEEQIVIASSDNALLEMVADCC